MGNLKTNEQQQVVSQKSLQRPEQVIVIQPANPQECMFLNTIHRCVCAAGPATATAFVPCRRRGASGFHRRHHRWGGRQRRNNYYSGPYAWHRPPVAAPYRYNYNAAALQSNRRINGITMRASYKITV